MAACWEKIGQNASIGKDGGANILGGLAEYSNCVVAVYIWLDAYHVPRCKSKTLTKKPLKIDDCPIWNYDGSSTDQASGKDSEIIIVPRVLFQDPFRGHPHVMVLCECFTPNMKPAIGNTRAACKEVMDKYVSLKPWFGMEQEYTLMRPCKLGEDSTFPLGFNDDGSDPAAQGPYYCGAGAGLALGRDIVEAHYSACLFAGVKIAGINAEVMPGQWEFQIGPCEGIEMGDHLTMARYLMNRVAEMKNVQVSWHPKPVIGDWNGAGCHTNFSVAPMRNEGGLKIIEQVCQAFGKVAGLHIDEYGDDNHLRLTGKHETCSIETFKYGVADRGASIRIPRETEKTGRGYMEDRRPAANCDPYKVTSRMLLTTGECLCGQNKKLDV